MRHLWLFFIAMLLLAFGRLNAQEMAKPLPADVRVVIDISGSMKKTDPQNLRKPAVDLIVRLLPDQSKAGIWTFGQSVNMLVPHRVVDQAWRAEGSKKAEAINSIAMFTNIGAALEKSAEDYASPAKDYRRNIILLTDGVVDISPEAVVNLNERKRVLTELLPRLKASDFRVHTIALSGDSDQELMKKLSIATDGIFEVADTADELMSTFLRIFDQAVPAERLPLDEKGFLVDGSIQEFTALIFRGKGVEATVIASPEGKEFSGTDPAHNVNWYRTAQYDLITVQSPPAGQWQVKTPMADGSRVTVVSNLQLVVQPLKTNLKSGQSLDLEYSFQESGKTVTHADFLSLLSGEVLVSNLTSHEGESVSLAMGTPADGIYRQPLPTTKQPGEYDLKLVIDGKTFKREFIHHFYISDSAFTLEKKLDESSGKKVYSYKLTADVETVDVGATQVKAIIKNSQANNLEQNLNTIGKERWEFSFTPVQVARYDIQLVVSGKLIDGSPLTETINADSFFYPDEAAVIAAAQPQSSASASSVAPPEAEATPDTAPAEETLHEGGSNLWLYLGIGLGNLVVLVLGYVAYRLIGGRDKSDQDDIEKVLKTDVASLQKNATAVTPQTVIDVSDDGNMGSIAMGDSSGDSHSGEDLKMADDLMADNLFPLDNMEEPGDKDKT